MYVNHDDLQSIATECNGQGDNILMAMDDEVVSLKCKVCVALLNFYKYFFFFELLFFNDLDTVKQTRYWTCA